MHIIRLDHTQPVQIDLVGVGGTGSMLLPHLARINFAIKALGGKGIHVNVYDPDTISTANIGRQNFMLSDVGLNKANVLTSRINAMFGLHWKAYPHYYTKRSYNTDIILTCVDNVKSRQEILDKSAPSNSSHQKMVYWLDCGNNKDSGQVVLGNLQRRGLKRIGKDDEVYLPHALNLFPNMHEFEEDSGPSCSLAEALESQDLMINPMIALTAANTLYHMLRHNKLEHHAWFVNMQRGATSPLKISRDVWKRMGVKMPRKPSIKKRSR